MCGYLNKILNSKVYDVAIETELQHAKNLSRVSDRSGLAFREITSQSLDLTLNHALGVPLCLFM